MVTEADELRSRAIEDYEPKTNGHAKPAPAPMLQPSRRFVADFRPPSYLIDGILQRRFLYSLTGKTGSGKTALTLYIAACVALGRSIGGIEVERGRVVYFAGENPDDARMRWIAMSEQMQFDADTIEVYFIPGRFSISQLRDRILAEVEVIGDISLVVVDTSAAYYEGKEVNSNTEMAEHGQRMRSLIDMRGAPCVIVNCHPVKNAQADNLLPLGAGAFLNEVDGNLTCVVDFPAIEVSWQGKFRGPDFELLNFQLRTVTHDRLKDDKGKLIPTVVAAHLSETAKEDIAKANLTDRQRLFAEIEADGKASVAEYARRCGFLLSGGQPNKRKTHGMIAALRRKKLITGEPGDYTAFKIKKSKRSGETADSENWLEARRKPNWNEAEQS